MPPFKHSNYLSMLHIVRPWHPQALKGVGVPPSHLDPDGAGTNATCLRRGSARPPRLTRFDGSQPLCIRLIFAPLKGDRYEDASAVTGGWL
eukprot:scaffold1847_cov343-Prasinococcus_capsulatus_cf.AAC.4